jgi:hypothetical protein
MRVSQQKSLNLCWHPAMFSSIHVARRFLFRVRFGAMLKNWISHLALTNFVTGA